MLRTYRTCNSTMRFSKYEFYNKLLGGISLLRVTLSVIWTQPIYIYIYIYILFKKKKKLYSINKTLTFEGFERNHDR